MFSFPGKLRMAAVRPVCLLCYSSTPGWTPPSAPPLTAATASLQKSDELHQPQINLPTRLSFPGPEPSLGVSPAFSHQAHKQQHTYTHTHTYTRVHGVRLLIDRVIERFEIHLPYSDRRVLQSAGLNRLGQSSVWENILTLKLQLL